MKELEVGDWAIAHDISEWIEIVAVAVIAVTVVLAFIGASRAYFGKSGDEPHRVFKTRMARGMLIGLDLLIAGDVIRTVTLEPTLENVAALGLLVLVRTALAWALVLEAENRWPWQREQIT